MTTTTTRRVGLLTAVLAAGTVALGISAAPAANAAGGCAQGYSPHGGVCMLNAPGPFATPDPDNSQCWFQSDGLKRCYPGADVFR